MKTCPRVAPEPFLTRQIMSGSIEICEKIRPTIQKHCSNTKSPGYQDREVVLDADAISNSTITLILKIAVAAGPLIRYAPFGYIWTHKFAQASTFIILHESRSSQRILSWEAKWAIKTDSAF